MHRQRLRLFFFLFLDPSLPRPLPPLALVTLVLVLVLGMATSMVCVGVVPDRRRLHVVPREVRVSVRQRRGVVVVTVRERRSTAARRKITRRDELNVSRRDLRRMRMGASESNIGGIPGERKTTPEPNMQ